MLEHQKNILKVLQNEEKLFIKEVRKSVEWLNEEELSELEKWIVANYPKMYKKRIQQMFRRIPA